jgi:hypothetical protein
MADLDLDITHYSISDLENFYRLNPKKKYKSADIELRESEIREQLLSSGHIDKRLKRDLISFLEESKELLIQTKCSWEREAKDRIDKTDRLNRMQISPNDAFPKVEYPPANVREGDIQERVPTNFTYTQPSLYFPGTLNPINTRTLTRKISVDTRFRENPYSTSSSDFNLLIPTKIQKVVSMELSCFEISRSSLLNISSIMGNNHFYINIVSAVCVEENSHVITVPDGHYSACDLIDSINRLLVSIGEPFCDVCFEMNSSGHISILSQTDTIVNINVDFSRDLLGNSDREDYFVKLGRILGFTKRKYSGGVVYTSETTIDPNICMSYFFLSIDDYQNNYAPSFVSAFQKIAMPNSILARISLPEKEDDSVVIESGLRQYFGPIDLTRLRIQILDAYGRVLPLNNSDYSFCLSLNVVYDL